MKISKTSLIYHHIGLALFIFASILWWFSNVLSDLTLPIIGLIAYSIMSILGIEHDLYKKEDFESEKA